ncbi:MAG TPA: A24 family peptidase [Sporichthya sp.]|nr:A24 family peptidase [Sporichthya sp.]
MTAKIRWEATTLAAVALGLVFWVHLGPTAALPAHLFLAGIGAPLAVIDLREHRLPNWLTLPAYPVSGALLGLAAIADEDSEGAWRALAGMAILIAFYDLIARINPTGMGYGDVKFSGVLGLYLGWAGWDALVVGTLAAFAAGAVVGLALLITRRAQWSSSIAFGPFMLAGAVVGILAGADVGDWYAN